MSLTPSPHDSFFKDTFTRPRLLASTLQGLLPPEVVREIDFDTLTYFPGGSVGHLLESASFADLVFSVSMGGVPGRLVVILEHKSAPDPRVHFEILRYIVSFWNQSLKEDKAPVPVLPVLFYHGRAPWTIPTRLSDLLEARDSLRPFLPDFDLLTVDLGRIDDAIVRQKVSDLVAQSRLLSMKHIFDREIRRYHSTILQPLDAERVPRDILVETLEMSIRYLSNVHRRLSTEEILSELSTVIKAERIAR